MTSNVTITKCQLPSIPGTKPAARNAQLLISTGIPSLDHIIGGGLPIGSILLVEEDAYSTYSKVVFKYFVAEGIVNTHSTFIASQDLKPSQIVSTLPAVEEEKAKVIDNSNESDDDPMKIAWRYQNMKIFNPSPSDTSAFGHYYDLTKKISKETIDKANITLWDGENIQCEDGWYQNNAYLDLLLSIEETIENGQFLVSQTGGNTNILRIAIDSLGSRLWISDSEDATHKDLIRFIYSLRCVMRKSFAVAIITVPTLNYDDHSTGIVQRIEHLCDTVIRLESFAGSSKETNPIFKDYHGLLHLKKVPAFNTLINQDSPISDLAFKLRRKKFLIEVLHLPPEFGDTTQREQDEITTVGCGATLGKGQISARGRRRRAHMAHLWVTSENKSSTELMRSQEIGSLNTYNDAHEIRSARTFYTERAKPIPEHGFISHHFISHCYIYYIENIFVIEKIYKGLIVN